jgi:hypothetical protein
MSANWVRASAIAILTMVPATGWAQSPEPPAAASPESLSSPRQDAEAEKAMQRPSGKLGTEEPSAHTPTVPPLDTTVFINGALAVPGASNDTDTVPAKFSARNSADDKLITLAYTFKTLPNDQRQAIYQALKDQPAATHVPTRRAEVGEVLPFSVATGAIPAKLAAEVPATKGYHYLVAGNRVLLVAPAGRVVVGVFTGTGDAPIGTGHHRIR